MAKALALLLTLSTLLYAQTLTIKDLKEYPRSLAKDFYIWHYLNGNVKPDQADKLFEQTHRVTKKLYKAYAKKSNNRYIKKSLKCFKIPAKQLLKEKDLGCVLLSLSPSKAVKMQKRYRQKLITKISNYAPKTARWMRYIDNKQSIEKRFEKHPEDFLMLFKKAGQTYRRRVFNKALSDSFIKKLSSLSGFDHFVETIAMDDVLRKLQKSLILTSSVKLMSSHARFYLALIKIKHKKSFLALNDLDYVSRHDYFQMNRDKALFWTYLITQSTKYLDKLYVSTDLNLYTLYAAELLNKPYIGSYKPQLPSRVTALYNESDPFTWTQLVMKDTNISSSQACEDLKFYENDKTQALYALYLEKCGKYAIHPYVTPYLRFQKNSSPQFKALFYAIGRQESRLVAGGISHVFAMGMMQIMPFLSKAIARQKKEKLYLPDMFTPAKNIAYARHHLNHLIKKLKHPLLIAYAYNAGRGYLKRQLKRGLFNKQRASSFEPFLSMELLSYAETREYGKKVLANYVVYSDIFDKPISLVHLLRTLVK